MSRVRRMMRSTSVDLSAASTATRIFACVASSVANGEDDFEIRPWADAHNRNGPQGWTPYGPLLPQQVVMVQRPAFFR